MLPAHLRQSQPGTCALIGLGQIGTSIGLALQTARADRLEAPQRLVGYDPDQQVAALSLAAGALDCLASSPAEAAALADLVIIAAPTGAIPTLVAELAPHIAHDCVITDVGSTKGPIVQVMDQHLGTHGNYVGGHPMAGREQPGPASARRDLFDGHLWVMCPGPRTRDWALQRVRSLARAVGAKPVAMAAADHDHQVAWTSHLPYVTSVALALAVRGELTARPPDCLLAAGSLLDGTRVAVSSPTMAGDYCQLNRANLLDAIDGLEQQLDLIRQALTATDPVETALVPLLTKAQAWRISLADRLAAQAVGAAQERAGGGRS